MGFFSYLCAKTGLPIMAGSAAGFDELGLCEVVGVRATKSKSIQGIYDGYGRVGDHGQDGELVDEIDDGRLKLVLKRYYEGESHAALAVNRHDRGQGYFHDWDLVKAAHKLLQRVKASPELFDDPEKTLDPNQWESRFMEYETLDRHARKALVAFLNAQGEECNEYLLDDRGEYDALTMIIREEIIEAWSKGQPAPGLDFKKLLENPDDRQAARIPPEVGQDGDEPTNRSGHPSDRS